MSGLVYKNVFSLSCVLLLTACSSTAVVPPPEYKTPLIQADAQYKYPVLNWTETAGLKGATVAWWNIYQDPVLSQLLQQLNAENLNLKQAEARYRQANALLEQQKASRSVSLSLEGAAKRNGAKHTSSNSQFSTGVQASWIPDVWGRVAKAIEGQQANLEAV